MADKEEKVSLYLQKATQWKKEMETLRDILLTCHLTESLKWGKPCYSIEEGNIAIIQPFKAHLALMFFKGALTKDSGGLLKPQGKNSQSAMRMEFTDVDQIRASARNIQSIVKSAIEVEKSGLTVSFKKTAEYEMPAELKSRLAKDPDDREDTCFIFRLQKSPKPDQKESKNAGLEFWPEKATMSANG